MSLPNLKRIALFAQKLLGGPTHTHKQTHRQDRLQYTAPLSLAAQCIVIGPVCVFTMDGRRVFVWVGLLPR